MRDDKVHVSHVLECVSRIEQYAGNDRDAFMRSTLIQDAVLRNLQTLAESTQRLSNETKNDHPEVEWRNIDRLVQVSLKASDISHNLGRLPKW